MTSDIVERLCVPVMLHSNPEQTNAERREAAAEIDQLVGSKAALVVEIERLREIMDTRDEADRMRAKLIDDRECGYLALIEKHATEKEKLKEAMKTAEQMLYDSGFMLGEAHQEIKRLSLLDQIGKRQIELLEKQVARLRAEIELVSK